MVSGRRWRLPPNTKAENLTGETSKQTKTNKKTAFKRQAVSFSINFFSDTQQHI